jgi:putative ubiquitin-RnfH superfamily antitoxin RatB of RatAB toxin-antitoxin module
MRVQVAYAAPGVEALVDVELHSGSLLSDAVERSGLVERLALDPRRLAYAIHGQRATLDTPLAEGDRVELLRPLLADPKLVRRRRAAQKPLPKAPPRVRRRPTDGTKTGS